MCILSTVPVLVLGKKMVKGKKFSLVKYKGWSEKFNEWLLAENVTVK